MERSGSVVNPDLANARAQATFDPLQLTYFLYEGQENTKRKRYLQNMAIKESREQGFLRSAHLSREDQYDEVMRKVAYVFRRISELSLTDPLDLFFFKEPFFQNSPYPVTLHTGMFTETIKNQATEEQKKRWMPLVESMQIVGTYAQTELGHGSFLRGLETTATYNPQTKEFTINSPTITSSKWWPGGLGKTSNHCLVMARLKLNNRDVGMQCFMVQIRDIDTHQPMPGVTVGDIGPKFGYGAMDNGFLRLDNIRVPRENMLMKYSQVLEDGTFVRPKNDRLVYGSMTLVRVQIVSGTARALSKAVTIATRYSVVRKQSEINAGAGEVSVLDFQTQQHKVFTHLAAAFALRATAKEMFLAYIKIKSQLDQGVMNELPTLHALSSCLKAFCAFSMMEGIETCRLSCGGHGYMLASGLPTIYVTEIPAATYEGENTVLLLQTARYLMKCQAAMQQGEQLPAMMRFMETSRGGKSYLSDKLELEHLIAAYEHRAASKIKEAAARVQQMKRQGLKAAEASNNSAQLLVEASLAFAHSYVVRAFIQTLTSASLPPSLDTVMKQVCRLYACQGITKFSGDFTRGGYMSDHQIDIVRDATFDLLAALKPNAVALVDAFDHPDETLDSDLGRYDGNVYPALMEYANNSKLNETQVHPAFFKHQKPFMNFMKARARL